MPARHATATRRRGRASFCCIPARSRRLLGAIQRQGMTLVPLKLYFNARGIAKVELGLAKGKKLHDKRDTEKKRDWERQKGRLMREKG